MRRKIQVIFQDPYSSLNPRMTVGQIIGEPLSVYRLVANRKAEQERVEALLTRSACFPTWRNATRTSSRAGSASASASRARSRMEPTFIVCDEPVSALDVSIQGQIINLLEDLQARLNLSLPVHRPRPRGGAPHLDRVAVMYLGRIVEVADRDELYAQPAHPYTKALLDAAPVPDPKVERARAPRALKGEIPSPLTPPSGCVFHTRCPIAAEECRREQSPGRDKLGLDISSPVIKHDYQQKHQGAGNGAERYGGNACEISRFLRFRRRARRRTSGVATADAQTAQARRQRCSSPSAPRPRTTTATAATPTRRCISRRRSTRRCCASTSPNFPTSRATSPSPGRSRPT